MAISAAVLVGSMPLIVAENLGVEPIGIVVSDVSVKRSTGCVDTAVHYREFDLSCSDVESSSWKSAQSWAWNLETQHIIQEFNVSMEPVELETIQFHAGESLEQLRFPLYRLMNLNGYLALTPKQIEDEVGYLIPELPFLIQGKEGERTLTTPKEVVEWKTEVVQQTEFMTRYFSYMVDVQEELSIVSAEVFVEFVVDTPAKGYLNAALIWKDEDCRLKNQWWFKSDRNTKLQVPVHRWGWASIGTTCQQKFMKWVTQPDLSQLMIMVEWTSDIQDDWPSLKTRILQFEDSSS